MLLNTTIKYKLEKIIKKAQKEILFIFSSRIKEVAIFIMDYHSYVCILIFIDNTEC